MTMMGRGFAGQSRLLAEALAKRQRQPLLPMDDVALDQVEPMLPKLGQFGAAPVKLSTGDNLRGIGAAFTDFGRGLAGGVPGASDAWREGIDQRQADADWAAELGDMELSPEEMSFAQSNPDQFKALRFKDFSDKQVAAAEQARLQEVLGGYNLTPEMMLRAQADPEAFLKSVGENAGKIQTDTYIDPLSGEWNIKPQLRADGGFFGVQTADGMQGLTQRPKSYAEQFDENKLRTEDQNDDADRVIRARNAEIAASNAAKGVSGVNEYGVPTNSAPPIPGQPDYNGGAPIRYQNQGGGSTVEGLSGGRLIRVGIGTDGRYAPTEGDPEIASGSKFPPPKFNTIAGLGDKAGPNMNAEQKRMDGIDAARDSAVNIKNLTDKYITQSEGYPFGSLPWDGVRQWADPRTRGLEGLNATLALEVGKAAKGAMSDADREWFMKAAPNKEGKPESNATFAMRSNAIANNANQYSAFMKAYRAEHGIGSLAEGQRYWDMYSLANPVFNDNGDAVDNRMTYNEFFTGSRAKRDDIFERDYPGVRGSKGGGLSAAEQAELEELDRAEREGLLR